ncbi:DNA polymerase III subunit gamma and tau [Frankia sp. Mgl5]|uniref:DNA polymerase III subunit gamma and tau n=1 Tax=Frankia sp. Mgl5 TaxID=2933793 RepID=UPI00201068E7|nr:DNA polymerase III subunit gamma and tau [Frankia sp. Mgl5]MCK9926682.1 DNA polymerase III subunit gamma and tau [Frankia sp. Mgl5]
MSTALYNRYRPATFAQVVGQEHVTEALGHALRSGRLHHAYLFSGPRGCGKTSSARILAASLNCEKGPTPEPCGVCDQCVSIRTGSSMDVTEIDAASHGLVDDARDLRERAFFAPASARFKVFVVDEAHMVTAAAFNALLKVVEEPPSYLKFVFATTEPDKVIATIRSRTHHYAFRLVPPGVLRKHLESICAQEGVVVEPSVLPLVVRAGAGSVRDSLSVLDQLLAGAGDGGLSYERAVALLGMTDGILLDETVDALAERDGAALFTVVDSVVSSGHDPRRFATDLLDRLRDLIVVAAVPDAVERGLLEAFSTDQVDRMRAQAGRIGPVELSRTADVLHAGLVEMRGTASPRLLLELILARALLPGAAGDPAALAVRLERLERRAVVGGGAGAGTAPAGGAEVGGATPGGAGFGGAGFGGAADGAHGQAAGREVPRGANGSGAGVTAAPAAGDTGPRMPAPAVAAAHAPAPAAHTQAARPASAARPAMPAAAAPGGGRLDAAALNARWDEVLALAVQRSRRTHAILKDYASVAEVRGDEVILAFSAPAMAKMFGQGNNVEILATLLAEKFGGTWRVTIGGGPGPSGGRPQAPRGGPGNGRPDNGNGGGPGGYGGPGGAGGQGGPGGPGGGQRGPAEQTGGGWSAEAVAPQRPNGYGGPAGQASPGGPSSPGAIDPSGGYPGGYSDAHGGPAVPVNAGAPGGWSAAGAGASRGSGAPGATLPAPSGVSATPASMAHAGSSGPAAQDGLHRPPAGLHSATATASLGNASVSSAAAGSGVGSTAVAAPRPGTAEAGLAAARAAVSARTGLNGSTRTSTGPGPRAAGAARPGGAPVAAASMSATDTAPDEVSLDDEDAPTQLGGARGGEDAAVALLRTSLGATVIEQSG